MKITKAQQDALLFAITQIEGDLEAAEDEDYIKDARQALKELYLIAGIRRKKK
ncbi:MAG: hypothetical protein IKO23_09750 [Bacteroidales bacterium]|nr:hypothetical protein [Bacteroidales bacterium]